MRAFKEDFIAADNDASSALPDSRGRSRGRVNALSVATFSEFLFLEEKSVRRARTGAGLRGHKEIARL